MRCACIIGMFTQGGMEYGTDLDTLRHPSLHCTLHHIYVLRVFNYLSSEMRIRGLTTIETKSRASLYARTLRFDISFRPRYELPLKGSHRCSHHGCYACKQMVPGQRIVRGTIVGLSRTCWLHQGPRLLVLSCTFPMQSTYPRPE